ncbi:MAG: MaoC family dehydratase [Hyphomonadaceae bacterium]|nr:MaoC family dehydratase [Hyphomonadaceae bacterium]
MKSYRGNFFEDFTIGQEIAHATPKTLTDGDVALYTALTGSRYALFSSDAFAQDLGLPQAPVDPLLVFHTVFGKSVPDISLNAVANLGYAEGKFLRPVFAGDTLNAASKVIGLKQNSNGQTGLVYVRTTGYNQMGDAVATFVRWVMVNKRDPQSPAPEAVTPKLAKAVAASELAVPENLVFDDYDWAAAGQKWAFQDYALGERIDHVDGMTLQEAEHQLATRMVQNTAKVHFDAHAQKETRFGRRLVYGGVAISIARALAFNGLANAAYILAINAGQHVNPLFAGDTIYAWSEVLDAADLGAAGALRLRLVATKDQTSAAFPYKNEEGVFDRAVILDFDYWALIPKR